MSLIKVLILVMLGIIGCSVLLVWIPALLDSESDIGVVVGIGSVVCLITAGFYYKDKLVNIWINYFSNKKINDRS